MMKNSDKFMEQVKNEFRNKRGRTSLYCFEPFDISEVIFNVVIPYCDKHKEGQIFICVDKYETRKKILDYFKKYSTLNYISRLRILSADFVKSTYNYEYNFAITVGINRDFSLINKLAQENKFILCILTERHMNPEFVMNIQRLLPNMNITVNAENAKQDIIYSPVEEHRYGVELTDEEREQYDKCAEYISTSITIFGEFSNIEKCKVGDARLGISATEVRNTIASNNGWNENLDTSIEFNKQIDAVYNPNVLYERACTVYNIIKQRRDLVTDNSQKFDLIKKIVEENKDKKILIISKRGEFASNIAKHLNTEDEIICGEYHDNIESRMLYDEVGLPILVKSGKMKGQPKIFASQALSNEFMKAFNYDRINVLSIKNSSSDKLKIAVDLVIITSTLCDSIIDIKRRFHNITFRGIPTNVIRIYCTNTIEEERLTREQPNQLIKVIDDKENIAEFDENNGSIIL